MMISCQEHRTVGRYRGWWVEGLGDEGLHKTFVRVELPFFLSADSLCKPEATKQKSGSTLTTHHLIPDFWSVPHILINSCILGHYTSTSKWDWRQHYLSSLNCYKRLEFDRPKLNLQMMVDVKKYIFANPASKQLYQRCPKRGINWWKMCY